MKRRKWMALGAIFILLLVLGQQIYSFISQLKAKEKAVVENTQRGMEKATSVFGERLKELMTITENLAQKITNQELDSLQLMAHLDSVMQRNKDVFGFGVGFEPHEYSESRKLFAPFFIRPKGKVELKLIEDSYDYTDRDWYTRPLNEGKAWFEPPYFGEVAQTMMAEYSVPFFKINEQGEKKPIGIVYLDYSLKDITKAVNALELGKSGYGFMFSEGGVMVAHPVTDNILAQKTLDQFFKDWDSPKIKELFEKQEVEGKAYLELVNPENDADSRLFFKKIDASGWRLGALFIEDAFKMDSEHSNRFILRVTTVCIGIFLCLMFLYLEGKGFAIPVVSKILPYVAAIFVIGLVIIWVSKRQQQFNIYQQEGSYPISDKTTLERLLIAQDSAYQYYHQPVPTKIPTGVFIKHIDFHQAHEIQLSGIVWQQYAQGLDTTGLTPSIFFMDASPDAEALSIRKIYTKKKEGQTIVGWYFRLEVREKMNYELYPFDQEAVRLAVQYPDLGKNVQLIPDLSSYKDIIASDLPGVEKELILPEWRAVSSFFDFKNENFNTNFGVLNLLNDDHKYNLGFNVVLKRNFFWPFMSNFIPLTTITILLFLALISLIRNGTLRNGILFNGFGMIELCSAFLFVAILTHIDLRSNLVVNYTIYMDYFYFHIYFVIISCSFLAVLFNKYKNKKQLVYSILAYWPILLCSLYLFSLVIFY